MVEQDQLKPARQLRIVLAAVGSRGDVQPMLALAQVLVPRGHSVVIAAPPNFEWWIRSCGFEFAPLGFDIQAFLDANPGMLRSGSLTGARAAKAFFAGQVPEHVRQLMLACAGADVMLWGGLVLVAPSVAQHLRLPAAGVLYTTALIPCGAHPPPTLPIQGLPRWVNWLLWKVDAVILQHLVGRPLNAARAAMGLPPVATQKNLLEGRFVLAADEELFPLDPEFDGRRMHRTSFIYLDDPAPLHPDLQAWLDEGEPPIFIGFGSMSGEATGRVARIMVEAVRASGRRCVVDAGWAGLGAGGGLPAGWRQVRDVPHALLFPQMALVVHHGGSGTTAQALRAGVQQVIVPLILDQYHHAHRLFIAGLIPRPVPMERITAQALTEQIAAALRLPKASREAVAQRLRARDARHEIACWVETGW